MGSHVLEQALQMTDWEVVAVDSFRHNGHTDRIGEVFADLPTAPGILGRIEVVTHDLTAPFSKQQELRIGECDYIVHAAARSSVDHSITYPDEHIRNNVDSTLNVLRFARMYQPDRYLHISTDEVFGLRSIQADAADLHYPSSPYAASKAACEDITNAFRISYGINIGIVNSQNLFGPRQSMAAFIPRVMRAVLDGQAIPIHTQNGVPAWRWYTYAPNFAAWIVDHLRSGNSQERLLIPGQLGIDVRKLAETIATVMDKPIHCVDAPQGGTRGDAFDHAYSHLPDQPEASWDPQIDATTGLEQTVRWYLDNEEWLRG